MLKTTATRRYKKPGILPKFIYEFDRAIFEKYGLDKIKGQGSIVLSVLQYTPMPTDSRVVGDAVGAHPEFKSQVKCSEGMAPKYRMVNYWLCYFRKIGLIRYEDPEEQEKYLKRATGKITSYYLNR